MLSIQADRLLVSPTRLTVNGVTLEQAPPRKLLPPKLEREDERKDDRNRKSGREEGHEGTTAK